MVKRKKTEKEVDERKQKFLYYLDEVVIFLYIISLAICTDAVTARKHGKSATSIHLFLDPLNLYVSMIFAILVYAGIYSQFKFNDRKKAPLFRRIVSATTAYFSSDFLTEKINGN